MHHAGPGRPASRGIGLTLWVQSDRAVQRDMHWLRHPLRGSAAKDRSRHGLPVWPPQLRRSQAGRASSRGRRAATAGYGPNRRPEN